jgi:hypothetical protein
MHGVTAPQTYTLEPLRHPAVLDAHEALELEEQMRRLRAEDETTRIWRAVMLAPTLEVCRALLAGERVPLTQLDPVWVRKFGIR